MRKLTPIRDVSVRMVAAFVITAVLLFVPAGTVLWGQGWVFMLLFFAPMALIARYLFKSGTGLLERRLQTKESRPMQGLIANLFYISVGLTFVMAGLDHRHGWSSVPLLVTGLSCIGFLGGYFFLFLVFKENKYLAHTVTTEKDQQVVTTGPYAVVRHPMYLSQLIMFIFMPMAIGSYAALVTLILFLAVFRARIVREEAVLLRELPGYREYTEKTGYRLVPGVW